MSAIDKLVVKDVPELKTEKTAMIARQDRHEQRLRVMETTRRG